MVYIALCVVSDALKDNRNLAMRQAGTLPLSVLYIVSNSSILLLQRHKLTAQSQI